MFDSFLQPTRYYFFLGIEPRLITIIIKLVIANLREWIRVIKSWNKKSARQLYGRGEYLQLRRNPLNPVTLTAYIFGPLAALENERARGFFCQVARGDANTGIRARDLSTELAPLPSIRRGGMAGEMLVGALKRWHTTAAPRKRVSSKSIDIQLKSRDPERCR